jgi:hypothetical protein
MRLLSAAVMVVVLVACSASREDASRRDASPHGASDSAYLAARDDYARSLNARYRAGDSTAFAAESLALRDLEQRLRPLIGPLAMAGLADSGRINLATLIAGDDDSGLADGLTYQARDQRTRILVTTRELFRAWIAFRFADDRTISRDPLMALTRAEVYTPIFNEDAAVVRYADLPLADSGKRVIAAMLVDRAQDYCLTCAPNTILLGVSAGERIFVVDAPARDTIGIPSQCRDAAAADTRPSAAIEAYRRTGNTDTSLFNRYSRAEDAQFAELLQCYGTSVRADPRFSQLVAQARALLDALPSH